MKIADVQRLKELANAATWGEWRKGAVETWNVYVPYPGSISGPTGERVLLRMNQHFEHGADAAFIAGANPVAVLALIADYEALRKAAGEVVVANGMEIDDAITGLVAALDSEST